jgi:hypothetical protein
MIFYYTVLCINNYILAHNMMEIAPVSNNSYLNLRLFTVFNYVKGLHV